MVVSAELKADYLARFVNKFGLGKLEPEKEINDNGILFHAMSMWLFAHHDLVDDDDLRRDFKAIASIQTPIPGLFVRFPGDVRSEAHDNYVGICALSLLHGFGFARDVVAYGTEKGFVYNSQAPSDWNVKFLRQGGDIAFYKVCAGYVPYPLEWLWLLGGVLAAAFKGAPSPVNLTWLRLECIAKAIEKKLPVYKIGWLSVSFGFTKLVFDLTIKARFGGIAGSFARYFKPEHPIHQLARNL